MTIRTGTILDGRWQLVERIAGGGMGDVYRAHDQRLERPSAIKVLHTEDAVARQRFEAEVATLAKLQHANIVSLFDAGEHDGTPFLVMAYVEGPSLAERMADGPVDLAAAARFGQEVAWALTYAHEQGIVHRDVKPSNVLFDLEGTAHLADFGIARLVDAAGITATGIAIGTAAYIAPEQLTADTEVGPAADVYSLGLVLLEAVTGRREFDGPATEAALARLSRDPEVPTSLPGPWQRLLRDMTARDPATRPSAGQVAGALASGSLEDRTRTLELTDTAITDDADADAAVTEVVGTVPPELEVEAAAGPERRWLPYLVVGLISLVALSVLVAGPFGEDGTGAEDDPGDEAPADRDSDLPAELRDAFETLHRTVQP